MSKLNTIKTMLQKILSTFNQVSTDGGLLVWDSDNNLPEAGEAVWALSESGERIPVEDKDYVTSEGVTIKVENGIVAAIALPSVETPENNESGIEDNEPEPEQPREESETPDETEQPEEPEQEPETENPEEAEPEPEQTEPERNLEEEVARLERENGELRERIKELEDRIKELESEPAAKSAAEEFKEVTKITSTGNRQLDNLARIMNAK